MSFHNTMPTAAPATLAIDDELPGLDLGPGNVVTLLNKAITASFGVRSSGGAE